VNNTSDVKRARAAVLAGLARDPVQKCRDFALQFAAEAAKEQKSRPTEKSAGCD
jgi:hypothetical protein